MRIEATLPDTRAAVVADLTHILGLNRSQLVDEALMFFARAVQEALAGRKVVACDATSNELRVDLSSPSMTTIAWRAQNWGHQPLTAAEQVAIAELVEQPPKEVPALVDAFRALRDHQQRAKT
jgi:hypothetical protein